MSAHKSIIVGVLGSGKKEYADRSLGLGQWLAKQGVHLITGGGRGVMASVSRAFFETPGRKGLVIGVLPCRPDDHLCRLKEGYPNPWVEIPIATHLPLSGLRGEEPLSRNHINILSSDVVIALPGGPGTLSEVCLADQYGRPVIAYLHEKGELRGFPSSVPIVDTLFGVQQFLKSRLDL